MLGRDSLTKLYVCIRSFFSVRWGCQILSLGHEKATESPQTKISNQEPLYSWFIQALIHPIFLYDTGILPCIFGPSWLRQYFNHRWQVFFSAKLSVGENSSRNNNIFKYIFVATFLILFLVFYVFSTKDEFMNVLGYIFANPFFVRPFTLESGHFKNLRFFQVKTHDVFGGLLKSKDLIRGAQIILDDLFLKLLQVIDTLNSIFCMFLEAPGRRGVQKTDGFSRCLGQEKGGNTSSNMWTGKGYSVRFFHKYQEQVQDLQTLRPS